MQFNLSSGGGYESGIMQAFTFSQILLYRSGLDRRNSAALRWCLTIVCSTSIAMRRPT
jgi:hypothetical protein